MSVNVKNSVGSTALLLAAHEYIISESFFAEIPGIRGRLEAVKWLLTVGGSSIKEANSEGNTALLLAANKADVETVKVLT